MNRFSLILCQLTLAVVMLVGCSEDGNTATIKKENELLKQNIVELEKEINTSRDHIIQLEESLEKINLINEEYKRNRIFYISNEELVILADTLPKDELTLQKVISKLGKPNHIETYEGVSGTYKVVKFDGIEFTFNHDEKIKWYSIKGSRFSTTRGIHVGSSKDKVVEAYSKDYSDFYERDGSFLYGEKTGLTFHFEHGLVKEIIVRFDYE